MRTFILTLVLSGIITGQAYGQRNNIYQRYVKYESTGVPGTITLISVGFGKKMPESIADASKEAFYVLLFRGVPGSQHEFPMISDEGTKKDHPDIKSLLNEEHSSFVIESTVQRVSKKMKNKDGIAGIMTINRITINYDALKRHLEQKKLIRKFGI